MFERILKQSIMNRVLYALLPVMLFGIYLYGWRVAVMVLISNLAAFATEYLFVYKKKGGKVSMAVFVTGSLVALSLPPTLPFWIAALGSVVAIAFGKMVFGGFGTNIFNPAILGRTFVYVSFPQQMTVEWARPWLPADFPGGFIRWGVDSAMHTGATILGQFRLGNQVTYSLKDTFLGFEPGSIGETSALLIILAGIYLLATKTAKWVPMLSTLLSITLFSFIFYPSQNPLFLLFTGGALFGIVYMVTDPVSQPKGNPALWIYGLLIGFLTVFIRRYSLFAEGFMFALLLTNAFMPIIEHGLKVLQKKEVPKHG
ncbi:MAG: RnfABCDGE type electron transport complex subunit D [Candidatus Syntrophosphaera sp.]|nr:RnfABCDGE type electron transport complex subunit D [Candidatus Syntrophosphaera sp.]